MKYKGIILLDVLSYPYKYPNKTLLPPYVRSDYLRSLARIFHEIKSDLPDISGQLIKPHLIDKGIDIYKWQGDTSLKYSLP